MKPNNPLLTKPRDKESPQEDFSDNGQHVLQTRSYQEDFSDNGQNVLRTKYYLARSGDPEKFRGEVTMKKMRYPPIFTDHFSKGECLLCEGNLEFSITIQADKSFEPNKLHIIIEKNKDYSIFEVYVCKNHTKEESFYELSKSDSPDASFLILGTRMLPKHEHHSETTMMTLVAPHSDKYAQCANGKVGLNGTECDCGCFLGLYAFKGQELMTITTENEVIHKSPNGVTQKAIAYSEGKVEPIPIRT